MKHIPIGLILTRLIFGFFILLLSFTSIAHLRPIIIFFLVAGILTDVFDGIIARKLGVSTEKLRRLDSLVDQAFWICSISAACIICPDFWSGNSTKLLILCGAELLIYVISYLKFRKEVSTHAILSKIWTISIVATLIRVVATCEPGIIFEVCFYLGIISRIEIMLILALIKNWVTDVPSVYHAWQLRKGREIKRNKYFNG
jgi:phosphatidylglycerophosphate synthase